MNNPSCLRCLSGLYEALFNLDARGALTYFMPDARMLGQGPAQWIDAQITWFREHFFSKHPQAQNALSVMRQGEFWQVFQGTMLLFEECVLFEASLAGSAKEGAQTLEPQGNMNSTEPTATPDTPDSMDVRILGTPYEVDCFGKIVFENNVPTRCLTLHAPEGKNLSQVVWRRPGVSYDFHAGESFETDGFMVSAFEMENDDFLTRTEKLKLYFSDGTHESRLVMCRGLDFPHFKHHEVTLEDDRLILGQSPLAYHFIRLTGYFPRSCERSDEKGSKKGNEVSCNDPECSITQEGKKAGKNFLSPVFCLETSTVPTHELCYSAQQLMRLPQVIEAGFFISCARLCVDGSAFEYNLRQTCSGAG